MRIYNYNISFAGKSNFPFKNINPPDSIANHTRAKTKAVAQSVTKTIINDLNTVAGFFKKVLFIDSNYPSLLKITNNSVRVNVTAAEILYGRVASLAITSFLLARETGLV